MLEHIFVRVTLEAIGIAKTRAHTRRSPIPIMHMAKDITQHENSLFIKIFIKFVILSMYPKVIVSFFKMLHGFLHLVRCPLNTLQILLKVFRV
jgi:hypothetical protein